MRWWSAVDTLCTAGCCCCFVASPVGISALTRCRPSLSWLMMSLKDWCSNNVTHELIIHIVSDLTDSLWSEHRDSFMVWWNSLCYIVFSISVLPSLSFFALCFVSHQSQTSCFHRWTKVRGPLLCLMPYELLLCFLSQEGWKRTPKPRLRSCSSQTMWVSSCRLSVQHDCGCSSSTSTHPQVNLPPLPQLCSSSPPTTHSGFLWYRAADVTKNYSSSSSFFTELQQQQCVTDVNVKSVGVFSCPVRLCSPHVHVQLEMKLLQHESVLLCFVISLCFCIKVQLVIITQICRTDQCGRSLSTLEAKIMKITWYRRLNKRHSVCLTVTGMLNGFQNLTIKTRSKYKQL